MSRPADRPPSPAWPGLRGARLAVALAALVALGVTGVGFADGPGPAAPPVPADPAKPSPDPAGTSRAGATAPDAVPTLEGLERSFLGDLSDVCAGIAFQDALTRAQKAEACARWFKRHATGRPDDRVAEFLLGRAEGREPGLQSMWSALLARLGRPAGDDRGLPEAWDALIAAEEAAGRPDRVVAALERRVALAPTLAAWLRLGWARERVSAWTEAEQAYRKALALGGAALGPANALALVLARQGRHAEAQKLARATVARAPEAAEAWLHLGLVLSLARQREAALEAYARALEHAGRDAATLAALGASYAELEEYALAEKTLAAALELDDTNLPALLQAATIAVQRDALPEARKRLAQAARLAPRSAEVAFLQGVCFERSNQKDHALTAYRKALSLDPGSAPYANALAGLLIERGSYETALEVLEAAVKASPQDAGLRVRQGFCALKRRRWPQAAEAFRAAAELAPKDPDPRLYLAVVLGDHLNDEDGALEHLLEYRRLGGREPSALAWLTQLQNARK